MIIPRTGVEYEKAITISWYEMINNQLGAELTFNIFYYMEESVLLGTKPLVDSIRHFIRIFRMSPL